MERMKIALLFGALLIIAGCAQQPAPEQPANVTPPEQQPTPPGGDRDAYGCIPSAGYSWCEAKQKCLRVWEEPCIAGTHDIEWARSIAEASPCVERGNLTDTYVFNENTRTWWIDMDTVAPGCAPACVVSEDTATAEINWRCTGALPPEAMGPCTAPVTGKSMELSRAIEIAEASICTNEGTLDANYVCNENTGTWWIDIVPAIPREGCSPACVVNINSGTAEVNYRCTGLVLEGRAAPPPVNVGGDACFSNATGKSISLARAINISLGSICMNIGSLDATHYVCNTDAGTWWLDINPAAPMEGCNPACVVNVNSETADVNWRCG
ncbi:MAG: hypothetical protein AB1657_00345 [Candidatus Micrarchaeota archaeon]